MCARDSPAPLFRVRPDLEVHSTDLSLAAKSSVNCIVAA
jgi:hypothetical protein